ncbi:hypothetical protein KAU33_14060, partial [Candidatus Dependentiae bacterium]|nr:hypothetical protein [Candidatus Dependentiae bacterium]
MKKLKFLILIFLLILITSPIYSVESTDKAGTLPSAGFLKISLDPRGFAMAEAGTAFGETLAAGIFYNPAALGRLKKS